MALKKGKKSKKNKTTIDTSNFKIEGTDEESMEQTMDNRISQDEMPPHNNTIVPANKFHNRSNSSMGPCKFYSLDI